MKLKNTIEFSLGYNFDPELIEEVNKLNQLYGNYRRITEFFAALPDSPYLSTRPDSRIINISLVELEKQVTKMSENSINFNYLLNAKADINEINLNEFVSFLNKLSEIGVNRIIAYSPELCNLIKNINPDFSITISSVYNIRTKLQLDEVHESGTEFAYLDSIFINRDFNLLKEMRDYSKIPLKLYANVSCISQCPNKDLHYSALSSPDKNYQLEMNDHLFNYCSSEKLINPVKWLQMQWIRPEDINVYAKEGFNHFKLTDRLSPTENLIFIAEHYLKGVSPNNLFPLIERNGTKYKDFDTFKSGNQKPFFIDSSKIPKDFIEHFKNGECKSTNIKCHYCNKVANESVNTSIKYQEEVKQISEDESLIICK